VENTHNQKGSLSYQKCDVRYMLHPHCHHAVWYGTRVCKKALQKSYKGFRPSARWPGVECWACWTVPARQKISIVPERERNYLCCFKRNNLTSSNKFCQT